MQHVQMHKTELNLAASVKIREDIFLWLQRTWKCTAAAERNKQKSFTFSFLLGKTLTSILKPRTITPKAFSRELQNKSSCEKGQNIDFYFFLYRDASWGNQEMRKGFFFFLQATKKQFLQELKGLGWTAKYLGSSCMPVTERFKVGCVMCTKRMIINSDPNTSVPTDLEK